MKYINLDFITNSSSSNYVMVYKKDKEKMSEDKYLRNALGIKQDSSLMGVVNHIMEEKRPLFDEYTGYTKYNYKEKLVEDYGNAIAQKIINFMDDGVNVFVVKVSDDNGGELMQQYLMYEESNIDNKYILLIRRTYGY